MHCFCPRCERGVRQDNSVPVAQRGLGGRLPNVWLVALLELLRWILLQCRHNLNNLLSFNRQLCFVPNDTNRQIHWPSTSLSCPMEFYGVHRFAIKKKVYTLPLLVRVFKEGKKICCKKRQKNYNYFRTINMSLLCPVIIGRKLPHFLPLILLQLSWSTERRSLPTGYSCQICAWSRNKRVASQDTSVWSLHYNTSLCWSRKDLCG